MPWKQDYKISLGETGTSGEKMVGRHPPSKKKSPNSTCLSKSFIDLKINFHKKIEGKKKKIEIVAL